MLGVMIYKKRILFFRFVFSCFLEFNGGFVSEPYELLDYFTLDISIVFTDILTMSGRPFILFVCYIIIVCCFV
jgi:hypothetical protein